MIPSRRLMLLLGCLLPLALLVAVGRVFDWPGVDGAAHAMTFTLLLLLAAAGMDAIYRSRYRPLSLQRQIPDKLALGVADTVSLTLTNNGRSVTTVQLTDHPDASLRMEGLPVRLRIPPQKSVLIEYTVVPRQRGLCRFDRARVRLGSALGLWERQFELGDVESSRIYPDFKPLIRSAALGSEQLLANLGVHTHQRRGSGTEFNQLREFRRGDSLRQVDWRATARFNRPISREYREERDQQLIYLLDCGRRMRSKDGEISHFDHALNALLLSAFVALKYGDSVGMMSFAGTERWLPPRSGKRQLSTILNGVFDLQSTTASSDYLHATEQLLGWQSRRALVVLVTSLEPEDQSDLITAVSSLSRRHKVLVASLHPGGIQHAREQEILEAEDALTWSAASRHQLDRSALIAKLRAQRIAVTDTAPANLHHALVNEYMVLKRAGAI